MGTVRDVEIVGWIGRLGAAGVEHVARLFGMDRRIALERLVLLYREGLLECAGRPGARQSFTVLDLEDVSLLVASESAREEVGDDLL
jgi:hypothetical protein